MRSYILSLHYDMHVPQNKIYLSLRERGIVISAGEIDVILSAGKDIFESYCARDTEGLVAERLISREVTVAIAEPGVARSGAQKKLTFVT